MQIILDTNSIEKPIESAVLAIGNFDGVHLGHQELLRAAREEASAIGGKAIALTFWPHPITLHSEREFAPIQTLEERLESIGLYNIDIAAVMRFDTGLASTGPEEFVTGQLLKRFDLKTVIIGFNHNFGRNRSGNADTMNRLGEKYGFRVIALEAVDFKGAPVSSSRIRRALSEGRIEEVNELMGRRYRLGGKVVKGFGRGSRLLGFPTANIEAGIRQTPCEGIYATYVHLNGERYMGALNIGRNPTFKAQALSLEVFILDFDRDIYGQDIKLEFVRRIREERRFANHEELRRQIERDVLEVRSVLE